MPTPRSLCRTALLGAAILAHFTGAARAVVLVSGSVSGTWRTSESPYVMTGDVTVAPGETLVVQPGVTIKAAAATVSFVAMGHLRVLGTSAQPVWFTALTDDVHGGDTNQDSTATAPAPGAWAGVSITNGGSADLAHAWFAYGGAQGWRNVWTHLGQAGHVRWIGGGSVSCARAGVNLGCASGEFSGLRVSDNGGDGFSVSSNTPPLIDAMTATNNAGDAVALRSNPGSIGGAFVASGNASNGIHVYGVIGGIEPPGAWTWAANPTVPYILHDPFLDADDTLRIEAGAVIKGDRTGGSLTVHGHLHAAGTGEAPVWFTSLADDARGGDTNGDSASTAPEAGDWLGVSVELDGTADLNWTEFAYGGAFGWRSFFTLFPYSGHVRWVGGGSSSCLYDGAFLTVVSGEFRQLAFRDNREEGLEVYSLLPLIVDSLTAERNIGFGFAITGGAGSIGSLSGSGNAIDGAYVTGTIGGTAPNGTWTWSANPAFPFVIDQPLVFTGDTLQIAAGAVIKGRDAAARLTVLGHLRTLGNAQARVALTSIADDARGGDTNADSTARVPAPGDWDGLVVNSTGSMQFAFTDVLYGGSSGHAQVSTEFGPSPLLQWTGGTCAHSASHGLDAHAVAIALDSVRVAGNALDGVRVRAIETATITACDIDSNGAFGLVNLLATPLADAAGTWWGDASGPLDSTIGYPDYNPTGLGQRVSDAVNYRPWAATPNLTRDVTSVLRPSDPAGAALGGVRHSGGAVVARLTLAAAGRVRAELTDVAGRCVSEWADAAYPAGESVLVLPLRGTPPRGIYILRVAAPHHVWRNRVLLVAAR